MAEPSTMFPSLDGNDPGQEESVDNLDARGGPGALPPLSPTEDWDAPHSDVVEPGAPTVAGVTPPTIPAEPEIDIMPAVTEGQEAPRGRRRSAEDRIAQLTGRYRAAEGERDALAQQVAHLSNIIQNTQQQMAQLATARTQRTSPAGLDPLAGGEAETSPAFDPGAVRGVVQEAIAPLMQEVSSNKEALRKRAVHEDSFRRATEEFPELNEVGSEARSIFDELYRKSPIAALDDGPEQLAYLTRGILASDRRDRNVQTRRKQAAAVHTPSTAPVEAQSAQAKQAAKAGAQAAHNLRLGDNTFATYKAARLAALARRATRR